MAACHRPFPVGRGLAGDDTAMRPPPAISALAREERRSAASFITEPAILILASRLQKRTGAGLWCVLMS